MISFILSKFDPGEDPWLYDHSWVTQAMLVGHPIFGVIALPLLADGAVVVTRLRRDAKLFVGCWHLYGWLLLANGIGVLDRVG